MALTAAANAACPFWSEADAISAAPSDIRSGGDAPDGRASGNHLSSDEVETLLRERNVELWLLSLGTDIASNQVPAFVRGRGGRVVAAIWRGPSDLRTTVRDALLQIVEAMGLSSSRNQ